MLMSKSINAFFTTLLITSCGALIATAQDAADALRFSQTMPQSTARSIGIGNAVGALGGDFASLSVNPAGIGVYRSSELTFTPSLKLNGSNSTYTEGSTTDNASQFTINNLGAVFSNAARGTRYEKSKWKAVSFGIGINRIADFNNNYTYQGYNDSSSGSEPFLTDALRYPADVDNSAYPAGLGYQSYLIDDNPGAGNPYYSVVDYRAGLNQIQSVEQRGGITEVDFSFGGNYMEKLFLGATIGIPSLRYIKDETFTEEDASGNTNNDFDYFEYTQSLKTTGTGINLKLGFIYNVNKNFRAGAAFHTPTFYGMTDVYNRTIVTNTERFKEEVHGDFTGPTTRVDAPTNEYQYSMITPWKGVISAAGILGKYGFISLDYEYVNYASARFSFDAADATAENIINNNIQNMYKGASNIRLGGEVRLDILMLRAGFGYYGNPYQDADMGSATLTFSAGAGVRFDNFFIDLGFMNAQREFKEQPYEVNYPDLGEIWVPSATVKNSMNNVALTLGFKF